MGLVELVDNVLELFRPKLPVDQEIVERERRFNSKDSSREEWVLNYVKLYEKNLEELKKGVIVGGYFPVKRQPRKVRVKVKSKLGSKNDFEKLRRELKLAIHNRNCNSGINYRVHVVEDYLIGEATPAITE